MGDKNFGPLKRPAAADGKQQLKKKTAAAKPVPAAPGPLALVPAAEAPKVPKCSPGHKAYSKAYHATLKTTKCKDRHFVYLIFKTNHTHSILRTCAQSKTAGKSQSRGTGSTS